MQHLRADVDARGPDGADLPVTPPKLDLALTAAGIAAAVALAIALRLPDLAHGVDGDEVANLVPGGFLWQVYDAESLVNPPLIRWVILLCGGADRLGAARVVSLVANVVGVALGAGLARAVGGRWWCAWLAGALLAMDPQMVHSSVTARAYGLWAGLLSLHLVALTTWVARPGPRAALAVACTAVVLPWVHYLSVPWLLGVGLLGALALPGRRTLPLLYAPAAVAFLPLFWPITQHVSRREPPQHGIGAVLDQVVGLDLGVNAAPMWHAGAADVLLNPSAPALTVLVVLLACTLSWRRMTPALRVLVIAAWTLPFAVIPFAAVRHVRAPVAVGMVVLVAPVIAAAPTLLRWRPARGAAAVALAVLFATFLRARASADVGVQRASDAEREIAVAILDGTFPPGDLALCPKGLVLPMVYDLTGQHARALPDAPSCHGIHDCEQVQGRRLIPCDAPAAGIAPNVIVFGDPIEVDVPGCARAPSPAGSTRFVCATPAE